MSRRTRLLPLLAALFGVAACGSSESASPSTATDAPADDVVSSPAAAELPDGWIDLLDDLRCTDTTIGEFPRTVTHDAGTTDLESPPERVVSIEGTTSLDMLLLMGVTPAAAGADDEDPFRVAPWQAVLTNGDRENPGFDLIAKRPQVNVEQIAGARPDLVISQSGWLQDIEDEVRAITPSVVVFDWTDDKTDWRDNVRIVGEAVGRDQCVAEIVATVEGKIAETRAALEASGVADDTFTVITNGEGYLAYHGGLDTIGKALSEDLGLMVTPADGSQTEFAVETAGSILTGDHILAFDFGDGFPFVESFLEQPTVRDVADRFVVMPEAVSNAGYYPSALGYYLWLDWMIDTFGPDGPIAGGAPVGTEAPADPDVGASDGEAAGVERIVVGNQLLLDPALALGLPVIGVAAPTDREGIPPYLADVATGVEVVAAAPDPNYEQLLGLAPDLIVVPDEAAETDVVDLLDDIARTETTPANTATPWPDVLRELAALTGRTEQAETLVAEWDERVAEFRDAVGDAADLEVSLVRCFRDSCRYLPGTTSFAGYVLDQLGVARPEVQRVDPEGRPFVEVSLEQIDLLDGDVIVLFGSDADDAIAALESNPLWAQLRAVQDDRVYRADPFAWFQGNVIAAGVIADELQGWLTSP